MWKVNRIKPKRNFLLQKKSGVLNRLSPWHNLTSFLVGRVGGEGVSNPGEGKCFATSLFKFRLGFVGIILTWSNKPSNPASVTSHYFQWQFHLFPITLQGKSGGRHIGGHVDVPRSRFCKSSAPGSRLGHFITVWPWAPHLPDLSFLTSTHIY